MPMDNPLNPNPTMGNQLGLSWFAPWGRRRADAWGAQGMGTGTGTGTSPNAPGGPGAQSASFPMPTEGRAFMNLSDYTPKLPPAPPPINSPAPPSAPGPRISGNVGDIFNLAAPGNYARPEDQASFFSRMGLTPQRAAALDPLNLGNFANPGDQDYFLQQYGHGNPLLLPRIAAASNAPGVGRTTGGPSFEELLRSGLVNGRI